MAGDVWDVAATSHTDSGYYAVHLLEDVLQPLHRPHICLCVVCLRRQRSAISSSVRSCRPCFTSPARHQSITGPRQTRPPTSFIAGRCSTERSTASWASSTARLGQLQYIVSMRLLLQQEQSRARPLPDARP